MQIRSDFQQVVKKSRLKIEPDPTGKQVFYKVVISYDFIQCKSYKNYKKIVFRKKKNRNPEGPLLNISVNGVCENIWMRLSKFMRLF